MKNIKNNTIKEKNIYKTLDGYYRFINHTHKLLTTGFKTKIKLIKYKNDIRFNENTIIIMKTRYVNFDIKF